MNPSLLEKDLRGSKTITGSKIFEQANHFGSPPNSHTNFPLSRNHSHNKSAPILKLEEEREKERGEKEISLKRRGKNGIRTKVSSRGHWRPTEDAKLKELVTQFGPQNWNLISHHLLGRSGKSCRLRWFNQLDPKINKTAFTEEEEFRLLEAHQAYGNKWALISRLFPGRTDNAVKNHWHVIMARRTRETQRQRQQAPSRNTVSSSCRHELFGRVTNTFSNEEEDDDDDDGGSAISTCTTELSLTPPTSTHQPRLFIYDITLASGKDGQCVQRGEVNGEYGKKMDHQNHHTITDTERKRKNEDHLFKWVDESIIEECRKIVEDVNEFKKKVSEDLKLIESVVKKREEGWDEKMKMIDEMKISEANSTAYVKKIGVFVFVIGAMAVSRGLFKV